MKKTIQKIGAIAISVAMLMGLSATVLAADPADLTGGEVGGFTTADTPVSQEKSVRIAKELTVYNLDETSVYGPTITYKYALAGVTGDYTITDETTDHASGVAVTVPTQEGITTGVTMTGTGDSEIAFTNADTLTASTDGTANYKYLTIDFSNVVFTKPGVYRYEITESLDTGDTYATSGVTETIDDDGTTQTAGSKTRYLDVYVQPSDTFVDGKTADEWDIYGYVCSYNDESIDPDDDTTTTGSVKTNGFVAATEVINPGEANEETHNISADAYYTFNVTISKDLEGDAYSKSHKFPVNVELANSTITENVKLGSVTSGTVTDYTHDSATFANNGLGGLMLIADEGSIKLTGIPCGTAVNVYETNDVTGVTYSTTLTVDGTAGTAKSISSTSTPSSYVAYVEKAYNSNLGELNAPTANKDDDTAHTIVIKNVFETISPTGVIIRSAPYMLLFAAGVVLLVVVRHGKKNEEEEEA